MNAAWNKLEGHAVNRVLPLLRCIASSDRSGVFLTESDKHPHAALALKLTRADPSLADTQLSRWRVVTALSHPHLMRIFEAGTCQIGEERYVYALMEHAEQTLAQLLERRPLEEREAREMLAPTLSVLAYLHERKFVHGRLKPSNILAVGDQLKLASDTVQAAGDPVPRTHDASTYDAPEARDGIPSAAGDVWALGVTLCEALTRHRPAELAETAEGVRLPPDLRPPFREIIARCRNKNPRDRPTAVEFQAWLRGEPMTGAASAPLESAAIPSQRSPRLEPAPVKPAMTDASRVEIQQPSAASSTAAKTQSDTPSGLRLVIRARLLPEEPTHIPVTRLSDTRTLVLTLLGAVAALALIWTGVSMFRTPPTAAPAAGEGVRGVAAQHGSPAPASREPAPAVRSEPPPKLDSSTTGTPSAEPKSSDTKSIAPAAREAPGTPPRSVHEVIPNVPRSARETIRGTVRVIVRVTVDPDGTVLAATSQEAGPSRYFERLALEASKKWRFASADTQEQRVMAVRFSFRREGTTARAEPAR